MDSLMKFLKWLFIVALSLGALMVIAVLNADSLGRAYDRWTFEHENPIPDVYVGMSREDILFRYGEPEEGLATEEQLAYVSPLSSVQYFFFNFNENSLSTFGWLGENTKSPKTTESLLAYAGVPFLESHNNKNRTRRYTYLTGERTGTTYDYETNKLTGAMAGEVEWRTTTLTSFYSVKGTQVCPGEMCPWTKENDEDVLKEQWEDKTVWDLIDEYDL